MDRMQRVRDEPAAADPMVPLDGQALQQLFVAGAGWLGRNAPAVDAINVFPVPDGDTGTNMAATMRGSLAGVGVDLRGAGEVAAALARNALMSARGNSGVILSQFLRGFARVVGSARQIDGHELAQALAEGSRAAYAAVEHPVEGTILTVARAAAEAAAAVRSRDPRAVLEGALAGARAALAKTPELLPVLRQAGVVDSGGYGFVILLEGAARFLRGEQPPEQAQEAGAISRFWLEDQAQAHRAGSPGYGYCTEFLLFGSSLNVEAAREQFRDLGRSLLVAGDQRTLHVHIHAEDPGRVLTLALGLGTLSSIKIENMQLQYQALAAGEGAGAVELPAPVIASTGVVGVFSGNGFITVARSLGITGTLSGGETANPSVRQLLEAIEQAPCREALLLPNHGNVILAAEQAAALASKRVVVVPTRTMPQGVAALLAFLPEETLERNMQRMQQAAAAVRTVELTRAARPARLGGREIPTGRPIGLLDGTLVAAEADPGDTLLSAVRQASPAAGAAFTLYTGAPATPALIELCEARLRAAFPDAELQTIEGGQPLYEAVLAIE